MGRGTSWAGRTDEIEGRGATESGAEARDRDSARQVGLGQGDCGAGSSVPNGSGATDLPSGGASAPRGDGASVASGGGPTGDGAPRGSGASGARGGGVAVGVGGAPPDATVGPSPDGIAAGSGAPSGGGAPGAPAGRRGVGRGRGLGPRQGVGPRGAGRPKRTLGALALGLCAVGLAVGSGADFSARTANPSNVFSAGSLSMENSKEGSAILSAAGMKPGSAPKTGVVDIKNTGSVDGRFTVSRDQLTNTDVNNDNPIQFAAKVVVAIVDCGQFTTVNTAYGTEQVTPTCGDQDDHTVYLGPLSIQNGDFELGTYKPGEKHRYEFEASLDSSAGNEYSGDSSSARYLFDAKQTP